MLARTLSPDARDLLRVNILVLLASLGFVVYFLLPTFNSPYVLNDDVRVFLFWVHRFQDPELFQNDPLRFFSEAYTSWGVKTLYWALSFLGDPLAPARWLPVVLFTVTAHYLFRLGVHLGGMFAGVLTASAFVSSQYYLSTISGGLPRSFSYPMAAAFLYYLVQKKTYPVAILLFLQQLFYTPAFLICSGAFLISVLRFEKFRIRFEFPGIRTVFAAILLGCLVVALNAFSQQHPAIGPLMNRQEMLANKASLSSPGGRNEVFPLQPLGSQLRYYSRHVASHLLPVLPTVRKAFHLKEFSVNNFWSFSAMFLLGVMIFRGIWKKEWPSSELVAFMISGAVLFEAAKFFLFQLYFPMRYLLFSLPLALLVVFACAMAWMIQLIKPVFMQRLIQAVLVLMIIAHNSTAYSKHLFVDASGGGKLFEFLQTLPKDTLIAAHPYVADNIPTFAKRKVFIMYEVSNVFFTTHWQFVQKRTYELFNAYFAEDPATIREFMEVNSIDYMLVDTWHFSPGYQEREQLYFEPFDSYLRKVFSERKDYFLANFPKEKMLFSDGRNFVFHRDSLWF